MTDKSRQLERERNRLLLRIQHGLEMPMIVLGLAWLVLLILDLTRGLNIFLQRLSDAIWIVFILHFVLEFTLAPHKLRYLRGNWITAIALAVPALRVFRIARAVRLLRLARTARGLRLIRVLTSLNRSMRALGMAMGRRGFGYVMTLTLAVTLAGAAGMFAFERDNPDAPGLTTYGAALWWTAMLITTMGSDYWPQSPEGRVLCLLLSIYALGVLGYITATLASFFVDRDAASSETEIVSERDVAALRKDIAALRTDLAVLARRIPPNDGGE
ncbi:MAG: ion transporter [FCB group bacterium]|jgi:voltage-gated potassium channel|nr:ion transporter [FCB group bacterium]